MPHPLKSAATWICYADPSSGTEEQSSSLLGYRLSSTLMQKYTYNAKPVFDLQEPLTLRRISRSAVPSPEVLLSALQVLFTYFKVKCLALLRSWKTRMFLKSKTASLGKTNEFIGFFDCSYIEKNLK